jgi:alanine or glycine:cation symporter, AGCS family
LLNVISIGLGCTVESKTTTLRIFMSDFSQIVGTLIGWVWGPWTLIALVGIGVYYTIRLKFVQILNFPYVLKQTLGRAFIPEHMIPGEGTLLPRQAASAALSSTVGVGNIVGVATALVMGGPGAIVWMWIAAFFGMATKYAEIVLSIAYREKDKEGIFHGGPAWYMRNGLNMPWLANIFTVCLAAVCLAGNMVQSNAVAGNVGTLIDIDPIWTGFILVALVAAVSLGGVRRLGKVTEKVVPIMVVLYLIGGIVTILSNASAVPQAIASMFSTAFSVESIGGGVAGYAIMEVIRYGVARGLYSNEAGMGTAPIAHASAKTDHPARQGMWGITEVFIDTFLVGTITALAIMTSGVLEQGADAATLASLAFDTVVPGFRYVVAICIILFAFSTIIAINYYGESVCFYLGGKKLELAYRYLFLPFTVIGAVGGLQMIWSVADLLFGLAVIPNLLAIALLSPKVISLSREFFDEIAPEEKRLKEKAKI